MDISKFDAVPQRRVLFSYNLYGVTINLFKAVQCTINWLKSENNQGEQNCFSSKRKINFLLKKNNNLPELLKNI